MARDLNKVQLTGRLGAEPEARVTTSGSNVTTFRVASHRRWKGADGELREETEWFRIVAWNKLADIAAQYLRTGSRVYVEGRLQTRSWDDPQSGQTKYMTEVIASDIILLDRPGGDHQDDAGDEEADVRAEGPMRRGQRQERNRQNGARASARAHDLENLPF